MMAMSMLDSLQPVDGMGPVGEVRIKPDPSTFVTLPYAPGAAAMLSDLVQPGGEPWDGCSRTFLKQAIADIATEGYEVHASFEPEFTLGRREADPDGGPDRLVPVDDSLCYSSTGFALAHDFAMDLLAALQAQGLEVESYYPELGHGQQEMTIRHAPRCVRPITTCCTGRPCAASRSAAGCGLAWPPSPCPARPATGPTCTCRSPAWGQTASPVGTRRSMTRTTSTSCPPPATTSSAACSPTCPPWSR